MKQVFFNFMESCTCTSTDFVLPLVVSLHCKFNEFEAALIASAVRFLLHVHVPVVSLVCLYEICENALFFDRFLRNSAAVRHCCVDI